MRKYHATVALSNVRTVQKMVAEAAQGDLREPGLTWVDLTQPGASRGRG